MHVNTAVLGQFVGLRVIRKGLQLVEKSYNSRFEVRLGGIEIWQNRVDAHSHDALVAVNPLH